MYQKMHKSCFPLKKKLFFFQENTFIFCYSLQKIWTTDYKFNTKLVLLAMKSEISKLEQRKCEHYCKLYEIISFL